MKKMTALARLLVFLGFTSFSYASPLWAAELGGITQARQYIAHAIQQVDTLLSRVYGGTPNRCDQIVDYSQCVRQGCLWDDGYCNYGRQSFEFASDNQEVAENDYAAAFVLTLIKFKFRISDQNLVEATNAVIAGDFGSAQNHTNTACGFLAAALFKAEAGKFTLLIPGPQTLTVQDFDVLANDAKQARALIGCQ